MALDVKPADIKANEKEAEAMQTALDQAIKTKNTLLNAFQKKLKKLEGDEKELKEIVKEAIERCQYHALLKKEIELRLAGKRKADLEDDDDRRVKEFINVVKKTCTPKFEKTFKEFEADLDEIKDALK